MTQRRLQNESKLGQRARMVKTNKSKRFDPDQPDLFVVATVISAPTSHDQCGRLMHIDCTLNYVPEPNETVCCSDGKTYDNL